MPSAQSGRSILTPFTIVPTTAACKSCGQTAPMAVGTGLPNPAALVPTMTTAPPKSSGKLTALADRDR